MAAVFHRPSGEPPREKKNRSSDQYPIGAANGALNGVIPKGAPGLSIARCEEPNDKQECRIKCSEGPNDNEANPEDADENKGEVDILSHEGLRG